ncbi:MAG: XTP/dITP diphosphatase [Deltaproteobacteria bacterium]|nr:XTP/dITP diphosphatase [Deltaproteobacteria bacterium]
MKIVVATKNRHKVWEIYKILADLKVDLVSLECLSGISLPEEDQNSFKGNALKKARAVAEQTGMPVLADDSGLEVDALSGRPGIFSARYAGVDASDEENNQLLLKELSGVPLKKRSAHYTCVIALVLPSGEEKTFRGRCDGRITLEKRGDGGFGYDPLFYLPSYRKTMAEISAETKNRISHRGRAIAKLKRYISTLREDCNEECNKEQKSA